MGWRQYIEQRPDVMLGKPVIKGTRLTVELTIEGLAEGASEADLLAAYPLPVKALILHWRAGFLPQGYRVQWAGADRRYEGVDVPVLEELKFQGRATMSLPVPVRLAKPGAGPKLRYLKFSFPKGTFKQEAELAELDFVFDVKDTDAAENP